MDACLGGFIVAFANDIGLNIPIFDFRLAGVTSISCDTHKVYFILFYFFTFILVWLCAKRNFNNFVQVV